MFIPALNLPSQKEEAKVIVEEEEVHQLVLPEENSRAQLIQ